MSTYAQIAARAAATILRKGGIVDLSGRQVKAVRVLREQHFIETGGLNSAFGATKIPNGDDQFIMEAGANPLLGEEITSGTGARFIISAAEPIVPFDVVVIWIVYAREG